MLRWMTALFFFPVCTQGQSLPAESFFKNDSIPALYLGIDFTKAKLINDEVSKAEIIQGRQFKGINDLIVKEYKKYEVQEAFQRKNWQVDLSGVDIRNQKVNPDQLKSVNDSDLYRLGESDIDTLVNDFSYGGHKGYGILLIVEGMSKSKKIMTIWFALVDMEAKKVLYTDMLEGRESGGFGFRNYWSSAIKNAINQVKNGKYDEWKVSLGIN
jgi:hypothetical protein